MTTLSVTCLILLPEDCELPGAAEQKKISETELQL